MNLKEDSNSNPYAFTDNGGNMYNDEAYNSSAYNNTNDNMYYNNDSYSNASSNMNNTMDIKTREAKVLYSSFGVMALGLFISAVVAMVFDFTLVKGIVPLDVMGLAMLVSIVAELIVYFISIAAIKKDNVVLATIMAIAYAIFNGITFEAIFLLYTGGSVMTVFIITAVIIAACSAFGLLTKIDMRPLSGFFIMGLISSIIISVVAMIFKFESLYTFICIFGVLLFLGITAYDVQRIKRSASNTAMSVASLSIFGGLMLYLDFVNIMLKLLRLFGKRR